MHGDRYEPTISITLCTCGMMRHHQPPVPNAVFCDAWPYVHDNASHVQILTMQSVTHIRSIIYMHGHRYEPTISITLCACGMLRYHQPSLRNAAFCDAWPYVHDKASQIQILTMQSLTHIISMFYMNGHRYEPTISGTLCTCGMLRHHQPPLRNVAFCATWPYVHVNASHVQILTMQSLTHFISMIQMHGHRYEPTISGTLCSCGMMRHH